MSTAPVVAQVLAFGPLNSSPGAPRRAVVAWSDGSVGEALRWFTDELLFCEGDLIGKTAMDSARCSDPAIASTCQTSRRLTHSLPLGSTTALVRDPGPPDDDFNGASRHHKRGIGRPLLLARGV
jgi:hypothetical protein